MNKYLKGLALFVLVIVLSLIFAPIFGYLHDRFLGRAGNGLFGSNELWLFIFGFMFSASLFTSLISTIFSSKNKYKIIIFLLVVYLLIFKISFYSIIFIATALIGWLLGEGILKLSKSLKK